MPRNSAGTYSAPSSGNPVVAGTPVASAWANALVGDLSSEISDSASRSGKGGFLAPVRGVDGSVAAPAHSFTSETNSGVYRAGAGDVRVAVQGTDRVKVTAAGLAVDTHTALTATAATVKGAAADGASAVGVVLDNTAALTTSGAKIASFRSNGVEKAFVSKDGLGEFGSGSSISQIGTGIIELTSATALIDFKDDYAEDFDARIIKATGANLAVVGTPLTVPTPVDATDAATKGYVDGLALGSPTAGVVTFQNDWADLGTTLHRWPNGIVMLRVNCSSPAGTPSGNIGTVPAGFGPHVGCTIACVSSSDEVRRLTVNGESTGAVALSMANPIGSRAWVATFTWRAYSA